MINLGRSKDGDHKPGARGEKVAADFLKTKGFKIIERNFRCKHGEIDLIATKDEYLVFVEVKSRQASKQQVSPLISVTKAKQEKLKLLGSYFLQVKKKESWQPRFDVVGITFQPEYQFVLEHIENAF